MRGHFAVVLGALGAAACLSRPALAPRMFTIDGPLVPRAAPRAAGPVLELRRVTMAAEVAGPELVYRLGAHRLERDPYAVLAAPPADALTEAIRRHLRSAGVAREVLEPDSDARADFVVDAYASDLSGDFSRDPPAGQLVVRFRVTPATGAAPVLDRIYASRRPIRQRTAGAVVAAWNDGLAEIVSEFARDVQGALPAATAADGGVQGARPAATTADGGSGPR